MESPNIKKLKELTPSLSGVIKSDKGGVIEYDVESGFALATGLYKNPNVSVLRLFMSKGTKFPPHSHKGSEWGIVYNGAIEIEYGDKTTIFRTGEILYCEPGKSHRAQALEDTWLIFVAVPANGGYPNV